MFTRDIKNIPLELLPVEHNIEERLEAAKDYASKILSGKIDSVEDFRTLLEYRIAEAKGILLFDDVFKKFTLDQLMVMHELIIQQTVPTEQKMSETIASATEEEKDEMFDFMKDIEKAEENNKFMQDAMNFMETGEFKE